MITTLSFGNRPIRVVTDWVGVDHAFVEDVLPLLGYRDLDALRRRVGEDALDVYEGLHTVKVRALVSVAIKQRKQDTEAFARWVVDQWGGPGDQEALQRRLERKTWGRQPIDELTLGQLCAALGVRADHRADLHNALRAASDAVCSIGLPGFSLGGERFTSGVLVALATRSVVAARAAFSPGQVRALRALSKAMSSGERMSEEQLAAVLEGEDEVMRVQ